MTEQTQPGSDAAPAEAVSPPADAPQGAPSETTEKSDTSEAAPAAENADQGEDEDGDTRPDPKVRDLIKLRKRAQDAERQLEYYRGLAEGAKTAQPKQAEAEPAPIDVTPQFPPPPDPAKFPLGEFDEGYKLAREEWAIQRYELKRTITLHQKQAEAARREAEARDATIMQRAAERLNEAEERIPDLRKHVGELAKMPQAVGDVLTIALADSDYGPEIVHHLATNEADRARIKDAHPATIARFIGRLEERFERAKETAPATRAPPPPKTVSGKAPTTRTPYDAQSMEEYVKARGLA